MGIYCSEWRIRSLTSSTHIDPDGATTKSAPLGSTSNYHTDDGVESAASRKSSYNSFTAN